MPALAACVAASMWLLFSPQPVGSRSGPALLDVTAHIAIFAVLTGLAVWCFGARAAVVAALLAYAAATEVVQRLLDNGRHASVLDVLFDALGVAVVLGVASRTDRRRHGGRTPSRHRT